MAGAKPMSSNGEQVVNADQNGNIYAASDDQHNVVKWVKD